MVYKKTFLHDVQMSIRNDFSNLPSHCSWFFLVVFYQISLDAVRSLGLLLEGSANHGRTVQPVHRLLTKGPLQTTSGYCAVNRSFPLHKLLSCLQHSLTLNPFGMTACLHSGKKLAWAQQGILKTIQQQLQITQALFLRGRYENSWVASSQFH